MPIGKEGVWRGGERGGWGEVGERRRRIEGGKRWVREGGE
jgi:hypothetical protein